jgi:hypothetical protein
MSALRLKVSVVVEWYNTNHALMGRAHRMLQALAEQAAEVLPRLGAPLEVLLVFDSDQVNAVEAQRAVTMFLSATEALKLSCLPVPQATYCELKNAGAAASKGDIVIFLDSDVIPEPGWLAAFLTAFADPEISALVGNTYVDCTGNATYAKAMAIAWMFPLRDTEGGVTPLKMFYANNVAFRREEFLKRLFPSVPGFIHAPADLLVERFQREGVPIWSLGDARASHPPPRGTRHFVNRAISGGKARALAKGRPAIGRLKRIARYLKADIDSTLYCCRRMFSAGKKVNLRFYELPLAMAVGSAYHALFLLGSVASVLAPKVMQPRFKL